MASLMAGLKIRKSLKIEGSYITVSTVTSHSAEERASLAKDKGAPVSSLVRVHLHYSSCPRLPQAM